jgi:inhibitor of KinA sporulation pathway (predicted exonuclease)
MLRGTIMLHIYLDAEFDAVKIKGKFQQAIISIGAVMLDDNGKELDQFYSLVRPMNFVRLTSVVYRMTHLNTHQIEHAKALPIKKVAAKATIA